MAPEASFRRIPSRPLRVLAMAIAFASFLLARPSLASKEFPGAVLDALSTPRVAGGPVLTCPPPCMLCHLTPAGGENTANQPFAVNLMDVLHRIDVPSMADALEGLETLPCSRMSDPACAAMPCGPCDADGDGTPDVQEIRTNKNPNPGGADLVCPLYGCGAHVAPARPGRNIDGTAALIGLGALVVFARRWRRGSGDRRI